MFTLCLDALPVTLLVNKTDAVLLEYNCKDGMDSPTNPT